MTVGRHRRRTVAAAPDRHRASQRGRGSTSCSTRSACGRRGASLPARALRRAAAAGQPRPGPVGRAVAAGRRRTDLGAGRVRAGGGAQPDRPAAARPGLRLPVHHARPGRGGVPGAADRRDVPRRAGRGRRAGRPLRRAAPPVHPGAAVRRADPRPDAAAHAVAHRARPARCRARWTRRPGAGSTRAARWPCRSARGSCRSCARSGRRATWSPATWSATTVRAPAWSRDGRQRDDPDPTAAGRHVRHGRLDALARLGRRHGRTGGRRQRLRRRGRDRVRPAGGRAAPQRPRRRGADHLRHRGRRAADGPVWTGPGPGRRDHRALPRAGLRPHPRRRPARRRRARRGRGLAHAAARPRHAAPRPRC